VTERVVSQLLTEMDGIEALKGVVVLAATNRIDRVDQALQRPGRFDFLVEMPLPDETVRRAILAVQTRNTPLADDVDLDVLAAETEDYVGADLEGLCHKAAMLAIREHLDRTLSTNPAEPSQKEGSYDFAELRVARRHYTDAYHSMAVRLRDHPNR
jgi:transitional endoplasmic reticulum ATPase